MCSSSQQSASCCDNEKCLESYGKANLCVWSCTWMPARIALRAVLSTSAVQGGESSLGTRYDISHALKLSLFNKLGFHWGNLTGWFVILKPLSLRSYYQENNTSLRGMWSGEAGAGLVCSEVSARPRLNGQALALGLCPGGEVNQGANGWC